MSYTQTPYSWGSPPEAVPFSSRDLSPWYSCLTETSVLQICVAWACKGHGPWTRSCLCCQQSKVQTHVRSLVPGIPVPGRRFSHVHLDLVGPFPSSQGFCYILTMIDRTSRWPEAVPLSSITSESCARAFISTWISRFGVPALFLTSKRGAQFMASLWLEVWMVCAISHIQTTSYYLQSYGMIKRFHRSLKSALRAWLVGSDWIHHLSLVMLGLCAAPKDDSGFSPAEAVFGSHLSLPG